MEHSSYHKNAVIHGTYDFQVFVKLSLLYCGPPMQATEFGRYIASQEEDMLGLLGVKQNNGQNPKNLSVIRHAVW